MKGRKLVILLCIASQPLLLSGCDIFADLVKNISEANVAEKVGLALKSSTEAVLLDMLDKQRTY